MNPALMNGEYVFCTVEGEASHYFALHPIATFLETEGLTLMLLKERADEADLTYAGVFRQITLTVHSSLEAVGLTAAVSTKLASQGISANVVAAFYHDHIFVQSKKVKQTLSILQKLTE